LYSKETKRWLRALEIAKILFEVEGYHTAYLKETEAFIRRKTMYSPKIREDLIPRIYQVAKAKRIKMTTLVNEILEKALNGGGGKIEASQIGPNGKGSPLPEENGRGCEPT
jgi:hypothetical protein